MYETNYALGDTDIRLSMPIMKVDSERRTVHGFATLDNLDKQNDVVPMEASMEAFSKFRGNIREQHDPHKAVGKMVSFKPEAMYDAETGKVYNGIFVSAYISRGAQDTWEKVLDGTLSGFSIGGVLKESTNVYDETLDKMVRVVKGYDMAELSLCDSPANPLANVTLIQKVNGVLEESLVVKGDLETIYMCSEDKVVKVSKDGTVECPVCRVAMHDIGFVESNDIEKNDIIETMVAKHLVAHYEKEAKSMAEQNKTEVVVEKSDEVPTEEVVAEETVEETEPVEKADVVDSVEAPVEEVAKADDQSNAVNELLVKSLESVVSTLATLTERLESMEKSISGRMEEIDGKVAKATETVDEFGKRVEKVEDTTAFRKSGDLGEVVQESVTKKTESIWGGMFLTTADL